MRPKNERQKLADHYAHGFHNSWSEYPSLEDAHLKGQDDGFDWSLQLLNGQAAEAQLERWRKIGLSPTAKDWAKWLHEQG